MAAQLSCAQAMRLIKFLAAERYFMDRLDIARKTEMRYMALKRAGQVGEFLILRAYSRSSKVMGAQRSAQMGA